MSTLANRLTKIEKSLGDDDMDRWIKSLTDEELEAEIAALGAKARHDLELRGVPSADMDIKDVLDRLLEFDRQEAEHVDAA